MAGIFGAMSGSPIPDLIIGTAISALVISGGVRILREVRRA